MFRSTSSFLTALFTLVSVILKLESNKSGDTLFCARQGIMVVSWKSWITVGDVVVTALVVISLVSKYYT
jgi:hypothetical protein